MRLRLKGEAVRYNMTFKVGGQELWICWWCPNKHCLLAERTGVPMPPSCYHWTHHPEEQNYWKKIQYHYIVAKSSSFVKVFSLLSRLTIIETLFWLIFNNQYFIVRTNRTFFNIFFYLETTAEILINIKN